MKKEFKHEFYLHGFIYLHKAIRRDTALLENKIKNIDKLNKIEVSNLYKWFKIFHKLIDLHHHSEEKILFAELRKKDKKIMNQIDKLVSEHKDAEFLIRNIEIILKRFNQNKAEARELLKDASLLKNNLIKHADIEDHELVPVIRKSLSKRQQKIINFKVGLHTNPFYYKHMIPWIAKDLSKEEKKLFLSSIPFPLRIMNKMKWEKGGDF